MSRVARHVPMALTALLGIGLLAAACRTAADTSQLSAEGHRHYVSLQIVNAVNDVSQAAILANATGALTDPATAAVLTINKQVLDYLEANPQGAWAQAAVVARNARDALPPELRGLVSGYVAKVIAVLESAQ